MTAAGVLRCALVAVPLVVGMACAPSTRGGAGEAVAVRPAAVDSSAAAVDSAAVAAARLPAPAVPMPAVVRPAPAPPTPRRVADIRVCAGGDITLGTNLDTSWTRVASRRAGEKIPALPPPLELVDPLRPLFSGARLAIVNVEGAIGEGRAPSKCRPGSTACFAMRQPPATVPALRSLVPDGVVVGNLANNHSRDAGTSGFDVTRRLLTEGGVMVTGVDTLATPVVVDGDTIGVLGFAVSPVGPDARRLRAVRRHVARAVRDYGRVIVTVHMGAEGKGAQRTRRVDEVYYNERRGNPVAFADAATSAGASLVIGHGPHVLRAAEWRDSALVAYSLGNLLTHGPFLNHEPLNRGAVLCATLTASGAVTDAGLRPTFQRRAGLVAPDPSRRALVLVDSLGGLDFPRTRARVQPDGSIVGPPAVRRATPHPERSPEH